MKDYPQVEAVSRTALRRWLTKHHEQAGPVWLVTWKKAAGARYLPYDDIVEEALCFGWIDSLPRALDATRTMLLLAPRKPGSAWSKPNRARVARLVAAGLMTEAGQAKVDAAKADGSWHKLAVAERGVAPADLAAALRAAKATSGWNAFSDAVRRRSIEHLENAKRPATRASRIRKIVAGAAEGRDPLAWRAKQAPPPA